MFAERTNWNLAANRLSEALARHRASGKPLLDLTASNPTECGFEYDSAAIMRALANPCSLQYEPNPKGLLAARQAVASYYADRGAGVSPDDVVMTTSTSEAYSFAMRLLCNPGDELLVPSPSYPLFDFLADIQDVKLLRYPLVYDHGWQIDFASLERAITARTRGAIVVHPNNPTGHFTTQRDFERLDETCRSHGMAIIADEVFLDFTVDGGSRATSARGGPALTFTMSGLSKISGLPQMKVAWLVASGPAEVKEPALARLEVIADTFLSMSAPMQLAAPKMLELRHGFQRQLMARVRRNLEELDRQLATQKLCTRLEVEGGWYAVLRVPATRPDEELALALLESSGVYVHPGHFYDFLGEGHIVVSLIAPEAEFAEGMMRLLAKV
jgi:aspartate/methionine/tyrosine aminotransferase